MQILYARLYAHLEDMGTVFTLDFAVIEQWCDADYQAPVRDVIAAIDVNIDRDI